MYRKKEDLYVEMAKKIYPGKTIGKTERAVGKTTILGCGYSMGAKKFKDALQSNAGVGVSEAFAKAIVDTYRNTFRAVQTFWYETEKAAITAIRNPGKRVPCGKVTYYCAGEKILYCILPSGRQLAYNAPQLKASQRFEGKMEISCMVASQGQWVRESTYGGKLVENITQAVARDLMAEAMVRLERDDFPVVLSVHDEIVSEISTMRDPEEALKRFIQIMIHIPSWAKGCPVEAEGWYGKRYKK